jgi:hypothetical protein
LAAVPGLNRGMAEKALGGLRASLFSSARKLKLKAQSVVERIRGTHVPHAKASDLPAAWAVDRSQPFSEWNGLRFELVHTMESLLKIADGWRELTRGLKPARHFHHVEWFIALTRTMDEFGDGSYFYVAIFEAQKLVGVVPLRVTTAWVHGIPGPVPVKALRLLSNVRETPSTRDVIFADSLVDADIFAGLMRYLEKMNSWWEVIALTDVIEGSHAHAAFLKTTTLPGLTTFGRACEGRIDSISCSSPGAPFQRLSSRFRKRLRIAHEELAAQAPRFVRASTPDELKDAYPKLVAVEAAGWKKESGFVIANHPRFDAFLKHAMSDLAPIRGCEIHLLQVGDRPIAGMFCVVTGRINFMHVISYDEAYASVTPGHLILENLIKTQGQSGQVDLFTAGHASPWFSASWKPDNILTVSDHYLFRDSKAGKILRDRLAKTAAAK